MEEPVRVDRWLWAARVFRSRSLASDACEAGHVDVNGSPSKAHKMVRPGDEVVVRRSVGKLRLRLRATSVRRGPAPVARELYEDLTPPRPPREARTPPVQRGRGRGRPTKKERRQMDRFRPPR